MDRSNYIMLGMLLCLVVAVAGCTSQQNQSTTSQRPNVQGVSSVVLDGPGTLTIQQGNSESFIVEAADNMKPNIKTSTYGGVLTITNTNSGSNTDFKYNLMVKNLYTITMKGVGEANATNLNTNSLIVTLDSGSVTLAGTAGTQTLTINGNGKINAHDLTGQTGTVTVNGAGNATVNISNTLTATVNGPGSIGYVGNPLLTQSANMGGTITKIG